MAHSEPWQVFDESGEPIAGRGVGRAELATDSNLIVAASHVWIWRRSGAVTEILLQKRASDKKTWSSHWDISAAGHVDMNETFVQSAIRECKEEINLEVTKEQLYFAFALRTPLDKQELDAVFLYELQHDDTDFSFNDGEVEELKWVSVSEFADMIRNPTEHTLVPQGDEYFGLLTMMIKHVTG